MLSRILSVAVLTSVLAVTSVSAIPKITIKGSKFFTDDGNQFYIKGARILSLGIRFRGLTSFDLAGIAYQLTANDPLIDTEQCTMDASLMQELGANTIRVYHVGASGDHKGCMDAFAAKGIYVFVDLDTFSTQINQVRLLYALMYSRKRWLLTATPCRTTSTGTRLNWPPSQRSWMSLSNSTTPPEYSSEMKSLPWVANPID
jgi:Glucanosyltransferase